MVTNRNFLTNIKYYEIIWYAYFMHFFFWFKRAYVYTYMLFVYVQGAGLVLDINYVKVQKS